MSSHKGIPVVAAFLLQMPCFAAVLFLGSQLPTWFGLSHFLSQVTCHHFTYLPLARSFLCQFGLASSKLYLQKKWSLIMRAKWSRGSAVLVWTWIDLGCDVMFFASSRGGACALSAFLSLAFMAVLALFWIHLQLIQLANLIENSLEIL